MSFPSSQTFLTISWLHFLSLQPWLNKLLSCVPSWKKSRRLFWVLLRHCWEHFHVELSIMCCQNSASLMHLHNLFPFFHAFSTFSLSPDICEIAVRNMCFFRWWGQKGIIVSCVHTVCKWLFIFYDQYDSTWLYPSCSFLSTLSAYFSVSVPLGTFLCSSSPASELFCDFSDSTLFLYIFVLVWACLCHLGHLDFCPGEALNANSSLQLLGWSHSVLPTRTTASIPLQGQMTEVRGLLFISLFLLEATSN